MINGVENIKSGNWLILSAKIMILAETAKCLGYKMYRNGKMFGVQNV